MLGTYLSLIIPAPKSVMKDFERANFVSFRAVIGHIVLSTAAALSGGFYRPMRLAAQGGAVTFAMFPMAAFDRPCADDPERWRA